VGVNVRFSGVQIYKKVGGFDSAEKIRRRVSNPRVGNPVNKLQKQIDLVSKMFYELTDNRLTL